MSRTVKILPLLLLLLLPLVFGVAGPRLSGEQAAVDAGSSPKLAKYAGNPAFTSKAHYDSSEGVWRVAFVNRSSGETEARAEVSDKNGAVEGARVLSGSGNTGELTKEQAIKIATSIPKVRQELSSEKRPYTTSAEEQDGKWTVHFFVKGKYPIGGVPQSNGTKEVARVQIDKNTWVVDYAYTGDQVGWEMARGTSGSYGKQANAWYIWGGLALVFTLAFFRNDKVLSLRNLDVVMLLGFLVSHLFYRRGIEEPAVLLWYPPLIYLFARCLLMGFGVGERVGRTSNFPTWLLVALAAVAAGLVLGLNTDSRVIDVGYAGETGAQLIMNGTSPYGHMPSVIASGDTYGPLNYLLYIPFIWIFGFSGYWDFLPAAHALTALCFVAGALAMFFAGWRYSSTRTGAALLFAWCAYPYTLYTTNNNTNDIIVAAVAAIGLLLAASPTGRGAAVAAGFAVKLFPLLLAPLWFFHDGFKKRAKLLDFIIGAVAVLIISFWVLFLDGHPLESARTFYERTLAFQGHRVTPWTAFSQIPSLRVLQTPLTILTAALAVFVAFIPRKRTLRRLAAFSAALIILFEITVNYWFYPYVTWFAPFVFFALLPATDAKSALDKDASQEVQKQEDKTGGKEPGEQPVAG